MSLMRGLVWHGARDIRLEPIAKPQIAGEREAIVAVDYCGICGTDLHEYISGPLMIRTQPHPLTGKVPPVVLGHEFCGRVVEVSDADCGVRVGDRVAVDPCWRCGACFWCKRGDYHICRLGGAVGLASDGAMAPLVRVPSEGLVRLPDTVPDEAAALAEPLAVALHALHRSSVSVGSNILILGCGPIGGAIVLAARALGVRMIAVVEPRDSRRQMAVRLGADLVHATAAACRTSLREITENVGPDVVFESSGRSDELATAISMARRGGTVCLVSVSHGAATVQTNSLVLYERDVVASIGYRGEVAEAVSLMARAAIDPAPLISDVVALDRGIATFDRLLDPTYSAQKVLLQPE